MDLKSLKAQFENEKNTVKNLSKKERKIRINKYLNSMIPNDKNEMLNSLNQEFMNELSTHNKQIDQTLKQAIEQANLEAKQQREQIEQELRLKFFGYI